MPARPLWEDLSIFLEPDEFGSEAVISFADGRAPDVSAPVIFDEAFLDAELGEYTSEAFAPRMQGREDDLARLARGDTVVIDGRTFDVLTGPQRDGTGWATVELAGRDA